MWLRGHKNPLCVTGTPLKESNLARRGRISDMDQVPSVPNLLPGLGLLNLMIWAIIDERFEPIRWSCEALIVFVSRVPSGIWEDRRFKDSAAPAHLIHHARTYACSDTDRQEGAQESGSHSERIISHRSSALMKLQREQVGETMRSCSAASA